MSKYYQQAQNQYDPSYNAKVTSLKNQLAQNQQTLEQQKGGINANYDQQVGNANLNNKMNKNNVSNAMLGRGLGNSSIAVSGLAEQDAKNTRIVGQIEQGRLSDLNNIDQQKALLAQNMENTLGQMAGDREKELWALANQLEDRDWDKNFKNSQLAQQKQLQEMQLAYQYAQLAQQREMQQAQMDWQKEQAGSKNMSGYNSLLDSYTAITASDKSPEEKYRMLQSLYTQADLYGQSNGIDTSQLMNQIHTYGKQNPIVDPMYYEQQGTKSNSNSGMSFWDKLKNGTSAGRIGWN